MATRSPIEVLELPSLSCHSAMTIVIARHTATMVPVAHITTMPPWFIMSSSSSSSSSLVQVYKHSSSGALSLEREHTP